MVAIEGDGFSMVLGRTTGDFAASDPRHTIPLLAFPSIRILTRYTYGDIAHSAETPRSSLSPVPRRRNARGGRPECGRAKGGLEITINDRYENFDGSVRWLSTKTEQEQWPMTTSTPATIWRLASQGIKALLRPEYDEVKWRRWSEWGVFPDDHISRTEGRAKARRDKKWGNRNWKQPPAWPWSLDETELGTNEFRSIKFSIYEASLLAPDGSSVSPKPMGTRTSAHALRKTG